MGAAVRARPAHPEGSRPKPGQALQCADEAAGINRHARREGAAAVGGGRGGPGRTARAKGGALGCSPLVSPAGLGRQNGPNPRTKMDQILRTFAPKMDQIRAPVIVCFSILYLYLVFFLIRSLSLLRWAMRDPPPRRRPSFGRPPAIRGFDLFDTPAIALEPLFAHEPLLRGVTTVAEPFCGRGNLVLGHACPWPRRACQ